MKMQRFSIHVLFGGLGDICLELALVSFSRLMYSPLNHHHMFQDTRKYIKITNRDDCIERNFVFLQFKLYRLLVMFRRSA